MHELQATALISFIRCDIEKFSEAIAPTQGHCRETPEMEDLSAFDSPGNGASPSSNAVAAPDPLNPGAGKVDTDGKIARQLPYVLFCGVIP